MKKFLKNRVYYRVSIVETPGHYLNLIKLTYFNYQQCTDVRLNLEIPIEGKCFSNRPLAEQEFQDLDHSCILSVAWQ